MTQESNFYHAGMWDGTMSVIESIWNLNPSMTLYEYAKKVVPSILGKESEEFLKGYFPDEYPPEPKESSPFYHLTADWIDECVRAKFPFLAEHPEIVIKALGNSSGSHNFTWIVVHSDNHYRAYVLVSPDHPWHDLQDQWKLMDALTGFNFPVCYEAKVGSWIGISEEWGWILEDMEAEVLRLCKAAYEAQSN